jgi:hypothetical protein
VHSLPSSSTSLGSSIEVAAPAPSQTTCLQSPATWFAVGVFTATKPSPHTPATQVATTQGLAGTAQSLGPAHPPPLPPLPPTPPAPPMPPIASIPPIPLLAVAASPAPPAPVAVALVVPTASKTPTQLVAISVIRRAMARR